MFRKKTTENVTFLIINPFLKSVQLYNNVPFNSRWLNFSAFNVHKWYWIDSIQQIVNNWFQCNNILLKPILDLGNLMNIGKNFGWLYDLTICGMSQTSHCGNVSCKISLHCCRLRAHLVSRSSDLDTLHNIIFKDHLFIRNWSYKQLLHILSLGKRNVFGTNPNTFLSIPRFATLSKQIQCVYIEVFVYQHYITTPLNK